MVSIGHVALVVGKHTAAMCLAWHSLSLFSLKTLATYMSASGAVLWSR